jgi:hypothetical protein
VAVPESANVQYDSDNESGDEISSPTVRKDFPESWIYEGIIDLGSEM